MHRADQFLAGLACKLVAGACVNPKPEVPIHVCSLPGVFGHLIGADGAQLDGRCVASICQGPLEDFVRSTKKIKISDRNNVYESVMLDHLLHVEGEAKLFKRACESSEVRNVLTKSRCAVPVILNHNSL